ncbi:MAG: cysteine desulfurase [Patescibacteria group bacterium]|nr:cysteine desulfurase [Patescibacteria group bacterium]
MFNRRIYLDYASLTPIDKRVIAEMKEYSSAKYANASSWYKEGVAAKKALDEARSKVAGFIHAHPDEIVFTSGGTEANNMAIMGTIEALRKNGAKYEDMHALQSAVEHSSVRECFAELGRRGVAIEEVKVDGRGAVSIDDLKNKLRANTAIVSVMAVNNETGVIQPVREIAKAIRDARRAGVPPEKRTSPPSERFKSSGGKMGSRFHFANLSNGGEVRFSGGTGTEQYPYPFLHCDAAQATYQEMNMEKLAVDLLTIDGSKICGPRGVGALYARRRINIAPVVFGGGQENKLRSGTENLPAIMGLAKAVELLRNGKEAESARLIKLRDYFVSEVRKMRAGVKVNGEGAEISPHIANVSIRGIDNEFFIMQLDANGVACSTKSSCLRDEGESYALNAMGADSKSSIRFSFGRSTTSRQLKRAVSIIRRLL